MIGLTSLEVYNSIFNLTEEKNKFELHTDNFDEFSFTEFKDELEEILDVSNITPEHLHDKIIGPRLNSTCKKLQTEERRTDGFIILSMGYAISPFREFESYLRIVIGLDEKIICYF